MRKESADSALKTALVELPIWRHFFYGGAMLLAVLILFGLAIAAGQWQKQQNPAETTLQAESETTSLTERLKAVSENALARKGTLIVGENDAFQSINPIFSTGDGENDAVSLIFESLVRLGPDGEPAGQLAERWQFDQDQHTLVFYLLSDHTFRDGRIVQAADVVFTYQCILSASYDGPLKGRLTEISAVSSGKSDNQVLFKLSEWVEKPDFRQFSIGIMKSDYYSCPPNKVYEIREKNLNPEGSGSFFADTISSDSVVLKQRSGYGGSVSTIHLRQVASSDKFAMLQNGSLDIVRNLWDARMIERAKKLPGYVFTPFETSVDNYFLVNPGSSSNTIIQRPSQRLAVLLTAAGHKLSSLQQAALAELAEKQLILYYFQGLESNIQNETRAKADRIASRLQTAGLSVKAIATDWPDLAQRASSGNFDILLLPATSNSRLPNETVILSEPVQPAASAWILDYRPEVFVTSSRLAHLTFNPLGHPFAAAAGTWTDRIENIKIYNPDGSIWEEDTP